jgi:O-antigen ligase
MKSRSRSAAATNTYPAQSPGIILHQGGLLAGIFLAPLLWGRFDFLGGAIVLACLCLSGLGLLLAKPRRLFPNGFRLATFHYALAALLIISAISYLFSFSRFASTISLLRLLGGALAFWLALHWRDIQDAILCNYTEPAAETKSSGKTKARTHEKAVVRPFPWVLVVFFGLILIACAVNDWDFYYSPDQLRGLAGLGLLVLVFLGVQLYRNPWRVGVLDAALVGIGVTTAFTIYDWLLLRFIAKNNTQAPFSTFVDQNPMGGFLGMACFVALAAMLARAIRPAGDTRSRGPLALLAILCLLSLAAVASKGAIISTLLAGVVFLALVIYLAVPARARKLQLLAAIAVIFIILPLGLLASSASIRSRATKPFSLQSASNMNRYLTWKSTLRMAEAHPVVGVGTGAFEFAYARYTIGGYTRRAHQNYLDTAAETGFAGGASFVWLLVAALAGLGAALRRSEDRAAKLLAVGALGAVLVLAFHSFIDYDWYLGAIVIFFFIACASGFARRELSDREAMQPPTKPVWRIATALLLLLIFFISCAYGYADREYRAGVVASAQTGSFTYEAKDHFEQAIQWAPNWAYAIWKLSTVSSEDEKLGLIQQAIELEPGYYTYRVALGRLRERAGDLKGAEAAYLEAAARAPQELDILNSLAELELRLGQPRKALQWYGRLIQVQAGPVGKYPTIDYRIDTEYAQAHYVYGLAISAHLLPGGPEDALRHYEGTMHLLNEYRRVGYVFDQQRGALGAFDPGKKEMLDELRARCDWRMAAVLQALGKPAAAAESRKEALALRPDIANLIAVEDGQWHDTGNVER